MVGAGSVTKVPDQASYHFGDVVQLTAIAASGWTFSGWSGDLTGTVNPATITITGNKTVTATFTQNEYSLTVTIVGAGSVARFLTRLSYHLGDVVQLTATPGAGWSFSGWSGDLAGSVNPGLLRLTGRSLLLLLSLRMRIL